MSRANDPVHPFDVVNHYHGWNAPEDETEREEGITLREHFAGLAMQGWLANKDRPQHFLPADDMAYCVKIADALIAELAKVKS